MSEHWYRHSEWTPEVEAVFEAKVARARFHKPFYLRVQGSKLIERHPDVAIRLLERCIELEAQDGGFESAVAKAELARAHIASGDLEPVFRHLESAIEEEVRNPKTRTSAPYDYASLVALHRREDLYHTALDLLDRVGEGPFALEAFQYHVSRALILWDLGSHEDARTSARQALAYEANRTGPVPGFPEVGVVPRPNPLTERASAIVASSGTRGNANENALRPDSTADH